MQDTTVTFTADQMQEVRFALNSFRYGGMVHLAPMHVQDADDLVRWLRGFGQVLEGVSDRASAHEQELNELKSDLRSVGRLFEKIQEV